MTTFRCGKCGCDEDTALCNYWPARVRDEVPACSACDPKIAKWHGQFPRIFGIFLVTPPPTNRSSDSLGGLVRRFNLAEVSLKIAEASESSTETSHGIPAVKFFSDDPVPTYKPLTGSPSN
jgi:hypothetical protein